VRFRSGALTAALVLAWLFAAGARSGAVQDGMRVEGPPQLAGVASRIDNINTEAIERALAQAGLAWPSTIRIVLVDRDDPVSQHTPPWVVGSASFPDEIVIFPDRIGTYPYGSLEAVLTHEIAHLALSARAEGRPLPRWFHEGVAVSVESGWGLGSQVRLLFAAQRDPQIDDISRLFASESLPATSTAYLLSAALIEDVRRRHGPGAPGDIAGRVAAGDTFEQAFVNATGETPAHAAATAWRVYRGLRWLPLVTSPSSVWGAILILASAAFVARWRRRRQRHREWAAEEEREQQT
jgi:hypothetical protein